MLFSRISKSFCLSITYWGCKNFLVELITSDRGITSMTNRYKSVCSWSEPCLPTGGTQQFYLPFLHGYSFPLHSQAARQHVPGLPALAVSLAPLVPQLLGQKGANCIPKLSCGEGFGGHLPLNSVYAEAKSQWHGSPPRSYSKLMNRENCSNKFLASSSHLMQFQHYTASLVTTSASQSVHTPGV